jgi:hypothetical protein
MAAWTSEELREIGTAEELTILPVRQDGPPGKPVTIWIVRHGDDLYVRSFKGRSGAWFRGIQASHQGRIRAGGVEKDITVVEETDPAINEQIDAVYQTKYRRYADSYVPPMLSPKARATTLKLVPR